jgi:ubiquinone/menaquinone biosynthesis C-methylase UbiE
MRRPLFIARQASCPVGPVGRVIASIMVHETAETNAAAIAILAPSPTDHVLDVGCGSGLSVEMLAPLVSQGSVTGIDPSPLMTARARKRNYHAINRECALIVTATVEDMPFEAGTFDAVMSVHTVYFINDLAAALAEIARVLRPGGRLVLAFRTSANETATASFPSEVYLLRSLEVIIAAVEAAGFAVTASASDADGSKPALLAAHKRT